MENKTWIKHSLALGAVFFLAVLLSRPVGVSTQFSVVSGIVHSSISQSVVVEDETRESGLKSTNAYYDRGEGSFATRFSNPWGYGLFFVLAIPLGAILGYLVTGKKRKSEMLDFSSIPKQQNEKNSFFKQYAPGFLGGFIILYGARMAGGCTSGHMMSGMMQGSVSGYAFALSVFAIAIPVSIMVKHLTLRKAGA